MIAQDAAIKIIKKFEGCKLKAYKCPAGVWTIGYGHTKGVREGDSCTQEQADRWLREDFAEAVSGVKRVVTWNGITANMVAALGSFVFNLGIKRFEKSTLLRLLNAGNPIQAADEFRKWVRADGSILSGLVARREAERNLFLTPGGDS